MLILLSIGINPAFLQTINCKSSTILIIAIPIISFLDICLSKISLNILGKDNLAIAGTKSCCNKSYAPPVF